MCFFNSSAFTYNELWFNIESSEICIIKQNRFIYNVYLSIIATVYFIIFFWKLNKLKRVIKCIFKGVKLESEHEVYYKQFNENLFAEMLKVNEIKLSNPEMFI